MAKHAKVAKANVIPRGKHGISIKAASATATKAKAKASAKAKVSAKAKANAKVSAKAKAKAKAKVQAKAKAKARAKVSAKAKAAKGVIDCIIKDQINQSRLPPDEIVMEVEGDLCMVCCRSFNEKLQKPRVNKKLQKMKNSIIDSEAWKARCPDNRAMDFLLEGFESMCRVCRQTQDLFRETAAYSETIGQLMKVAVALKDSILREHCHAMAKIIYDPDQTPVAAEDVRDLLFKGRPQMVSLTQKLSEIRHLLKMQNRQWAAEEKVGQDKQVLKMYHRALATSVKLA